MGEDQYTAPIGRTLSSLGNNQIIEQLTWNTAAECIGELGDEIIVDAVLERSENDHGTRVLYRQLLHGLVREHVLFAACNRLIEYIWTTPRRAPEDPEEGARRRRRRRLVVTSDHRDLLQRHTSSPTQTAETKEKKRQHHPRRGQT